MLDISLCLSSAVFPLGNKKEKLKAQKKVFKVYEKLGAEEEQYKGDMKTCENKDYSARQASRYRLELHMVAAKY